MQSPMHDWAVLMMGVFAWGSLLALPAAGVALAMKRSALAQALAIAATVLPLLTLMISVVLIVIAFGDVAKADAASKATLLAQGISEAMNCGALTLPALLVGPFLWYRAARQLRTQTPGPT